MSTLKLNIPFQRNARVNWYEIYLITKECGFRNETA